MLYKLEYIQGWKSQSDPGVLIHLRVNPPVFLKFTPIEDITEDSDPFARAISEIPGVTDILLTAYRVFVQKSPSYRWDEVLPTLLNTIQTSLGFDSRGELEPPVGGPETGNTDPVPNKSDRRTWPLSNSNSNSS